MDRDVDVTLNRAVVDHDVCLVVGPVIERSKGAWRAALANGLERPKRAPGKALP